MQNSIRLFSGLYLKIVLLAVAVETAVRIILLFNGQTTDLGFTAGEWLEVFLLGAVNDAAAATLGFGFLWLFMLTIGDGKYARPWGWMLLGLLAAAFCYVTFFHTVFDDYGSVVPTIVSGLTGFWLLGFAVRLFLPRIRRGWRMAWFGLLLTIYTGVILFNGVCEYFFWNEFGVRYNFIAVDYLVYTNEVVGNIWESYPIVPLMSLLLLATLALTWVLFRGEVRRVNELRGAAWKGVASVGYLAAVVLAGGLLSFNTRFQDSPNVYVNELQANGLYKFYDAFRKNELDYRQFYLTLPDDEAAAAVHEASGNRIITAAPHANDTIPQRNIVLITIESMSASFMERFGNPDGLTPVLDSLYDRGLGFERLFATGNRTVRGLEAVTLSLPPCPGQSLIKRPDNGGLPSTGALLGRQGYKVRYFYGGNSYFDNMEAFFGGNGYEITDKAQYSPEEITFANIWGVCDEDAYRKVIRTLDADAAAGQPFFAHVMTVSNHRPFTYPTGKIAIPPETKSRAGGVRYSDYALGRFFSEAAQRPWFANTVFVITADHCASSAGKTEIPLGKYHIPALIYAPELVAPGSVRQTVSQIDLMPTLFGLLGMASDPHFYGRNALADGYIPRAFIATYQDLGYLEGDVLTILSPIERCEQYRLAPRPDDPFALEPVSSVDSAHLRRAIGFYQTSANPQKLR